ncbi:MAG: sulfatase-like hydrolase/transferase [Candidatus Lokiarchaeota archaeon]|nr:sulfatase-like hydrolase/transferase [Candidatus Lokiarchaeota archaeon]MBD3201791.1 sulfatase-like hydrolase/transferase [Candidatus Lokiarchaeota archaeon]
MSEKMNVLFIITDQQRADHLGCYGNKTLKTPNIDKLANDSIRFSNAFCANPMCMPNRATLLTGLYPNMHGVRSNGINLSEEIPTITDTLRSRGWYTKAIGKMHLQFNFPPYKRSSESYEMISQWNRPKTANQMRNRFKSPYYGFEDVEITLGHGDLMSGHYIDWLEEKSPKHVLEIKKRFTKFFDNLMYKTTLPEELYPTTYVKERTINFLEKYAKGDYGEKPFFLHCSIPDPHHPVCPPGNYYDMYDPDKIELPESFSNKNSLYEHHILGEHLKNPIFSGATLRDSSEEEIREFIALTYGSISMIDHNVGEILATLHKLGLEDNTMVIYTSDHGDLSGDHGLLLKGPCPFSGILNVPLLWKIPKITKGKLSDALISSIDIPPTILNLLKIRDRHHPPDIQGYDFSEVIKNQKDKIRDCCFIEEDEEIKNLKFRLRHLVTENYKLTMYESAQIGDLFHRKNDPHELHNLWFENEKVRNELVLKMLNESLKTQSRYPKRASLT